MHASFQQSSTVSLGKSHGYRFEGDTAILTAELALGGAGARAADAPGDIAASAGRNGAAGFALQLWACDEPYQGGELRGIKVAEAELALPDSLGGQATQLETAASAQLPPAQREYAMVLVLASGEAGIYDQVHDFSNYPLRQGFTGPHLEGTVGYRFLDQGVLLQADAIANPRDASNLSGTLALELWALAAPYQGGSFTGVRVAHAELGPIAGQTRREAVERLVPLHAPAAGNWHLTLMLREWTFAFGYVTRDFCNFSELHRVGLPRALGEHADELVYDARESADVLGVDQAWPSAAAPSDCTDSHASAGLQSADEQRGVQTSERESDAARVGEREQEASAPPASATVQTLVAPTSTTPVPEAAGVTAAAVVAAPVALTASLAAAPLVATPIAAAPLAPPAAASVEARPESAAELKRVSVARGSLDALSQVPGLNKKLAAAIVRGRPYKTLDELTKIRGIGDKILQRLRPYLTL